MAVLDLKLFRDIARLKVQALAISLIMACGVATIVIAIGASRSLDETRSAFYERYRFARIFASAKRAPNHLASRIGAIPGTSTVETRIVLPVILDILGMPEPAGGIAVSIPDFGEPSLNRLYIREGRLPETGRTDEVAVVEPFARAHGFKPGDNFQILMNGHKRTVTIVGIVLSPEYIYAIGPGDIVPDQKRYAIMFMNRKVLAAAHDMDGAFNNVTLTMQRNGDERAIIEALDDILKPYGGTGAYGRKDQTSHSFLDGELQSLAAMAKVIPPIFLFVSAFLVNMILSRLITLEREQIGLMKAVGYYDREIVWHYFSFALLISIGGIAIGAVAGTWLGYGLTVLYRDFFTFPFLIFRSSADLYFLAGGITLAAALAGAANSIGAILRLHPAVAMRPPAPTTFLNLFDWRLLRGFVSQLFVMAIRHLIRFALRSFFTMLGTSFSVALLVTALFTFDSIDTMIDSIYFRTERQDATISFSEDQAASSIASILNLPGVLAAEPYLSGQVKLVNGHRSRKIPIIGLITDGELGQVLDPDGNPMRLPSSGVVLSERVAKLLDAGIGDTLDAEFLQTGNPATTLPVTAIAQGYIGLVAHMEIGALGRAMMRPNRISGARVRIDANALPALYREIKKTPEIASISLLNVSRQRFRETIKENIVIMSVVYVALALITTFGVIYNTARIQLSERAREFASLCVLGFYRMEVSYILLMEIGILTFLAQPLGWLLGYGFSWAVARGFENDQFRVPLVVEPSTFARASLVVLAAATVGALIVRRRIDRLDLVSVLKTRE